MEDNIVRFFECFLPVTACNLRCSYCYVIQRQNRKNELPHFAYSPQQIGLALTKERLGGTCYFSICGAGETMIPIEIIPIVEKLLENGHYVNLTTNGTLTNRFDEFLAFPKSYLERLHFSFSFHYLELKRLHLLDAFFDNVTKVKTAGCSILVQLNLCDEYNPYLEDIKSICLEKVGAYPQIAATRKENNLSDDIEFMTDSVDEYQKRGSSFHSPLFDFTMKNFNVKRKEFCYAGDWSFTLDLATGVASRCYFSHVTQDIFKNPDEPIRFVAVGHHCRSLFCMNASHFMALGIIPSISAPTYASLRNRIEANWYSEKMQAFLNGKLSSSHKSYGFFKKVKTEIYNLLEILYIAYGKTVGHLKREMHKK